MIRNCAQRDLIGGVESRLSDIVLPVKEEERAAARQIVGNQARQQIRIGVISRIDRPQLAGFVTFGRASGNAAGSQTYRIQMRIGDAQREIFQQPRLLDLRAELQAVAPANDRPDRPSPRSS